MRLNLPHNAILVKYPQRNPLRLEYDSDSLVTKYGSWILLYDHVLTAKTALTRAELDHVIHIVLQHSFHCQPQQLHGRL